MPLYVKEREIDSTHHLPAQGLCIDRQALQRAADEGRDYGCSCFLSTGSILGRFWD